MIKLMTLSFYLTWTPYAIDCILAMSGIRVPENVKIFALLFSKSGTVINPALYIYSITKVSKFKMNSLYILIEYNQSTENKIYCYHFKITLISES